MEGWIVVMMRLYLILKVAFEMGCLVMVWEGALVMRSHMFGSWRVFPSGLRSSHLDED
jgi:hypothetical protein